MKSLFNSFKRWVFYYLVYRRDNNKYFRHLGMRVGQGCRIHRIHAGSEPWLIKIGENTTVSDGVFLVTHDGSTRLFRKDYPQLNPYFGNVFGPIVIGRNCFVGVGTIILPGVTIGDECIIGSGSVVTKDIPPRSVAFGNPARVHKSLDDYIQQQINNVLPVKATTREELRRELLAVFGDRLR